MQNLLHIIRGLKNKQIIISDSNSDKWGKTLDEFVIMDFFSIPKEQIQKSQICVNIRNEKDNATVKNAIIAAYPGISFIS